MKNTCTFFLFGLIISIAAPAQENLVNYAEVTFASELEKKILDDHFINKKTDLFLLFMASGNLLKEGSVEEAKTRFYNHLAQINTEKLTAKKNEKKIKFLYDDIHSTFLAKYETKNHFEEIFYNGYYNCVSASALYAIAFQHLNIPYSVKEKPTHVYLIAFPEADRIMVETTTPATSFITMDQQFKQNFVKVLKDQKVISAREFASGNVNEIFDKFYFGEQESITLLQLLGLQYLNAAIYHLEAEKHLDALHQVEKAYLFYPSERAGYLLMITAYEAFKKSEKKDLEHARCLAKLARYKKYGITADMILGEFAQVIQELLFDKGEKEKLAEYHATLQQLISNDELRSEIKFAYNYENGRLLYNQARYKESIPFFEEALKVKPNHQDANAIFISCIAQSVKNKSNTELLSSLEEYSAKYPFLQQNNIFNEMMGSAYLIEFEINFSTNRSADGEKYRAVFEDFYKAHSEVSYNPFLMGKAYSSAAVYYFRKGQTSRAKSLIAKGLELSPNNYELMSRKRMIE